MAGVFVTVFLACLLLPGAYSGFVTLGRGCLDNQDKHHHPGDVWYVVGECAKYGCYNQDNPSTYKMTCPEPPVPDCAYDLVSSPDDPYPLCCITPVCRT